MINMNLECYWQQNTFTRHVYQQALGLAPSCLSCPIYLAKVEISVREPGLKAKHAGMYLLLSQQLSH